jgi:Multicopper oxidase
MTRRSGRRPPGTPRALRFALPIVATVAIVAPLAWLWQDSWVPGVYSVMDMGYLDYGVGAMAGTGGGHGGHMRGQMPGHDMPTPRLVTDMVADPARPADVRVELVTRQQTLSVGGRSIPGFTVNGTSPGPEIRARQGQLVEVQLRNESVTDGVTGPSTSGPRVAGAIGGRRSKASCSLLVLAAPPAMCTSKHPRDGLRLRGPAAFTALRRLTAGGDAVRAGLR